MCDEEEHNVFLHIKLPSVKNEFEAELVTTQSLGRPQIPALPYENPDGTPLEIDSDYFGKKRNTDNPVPGPFEIPNEGEVVLKVW